MKPRNLKVFITDDSEIILEKIPQMLQKIGGIQIVGIARDSANTLKTVKELQPDVIVLDVILPDKSGIDTLKIIKEEKLVPIVIMFTNYPLREYSRRCFELGADFFYDKSKEFGELIGTLQELRKSFV